ncbi:S1C family serine protease [Roseomonas sp. CCTCC AB2023176]|uniref:S1C family serine protease n=1 Tax=Roseomonas sp. CCTCC AB2023176 TaxID=3342640 RepID=UPI0035E0BB0B
MHRIGARQGLAVGVVGTVLAGCAPQGTVLGPPPGVGPVPPGGSVVTFYDPNTNQPVRSYVVGATPRAAGVQPGYAEAPPVVPPSGPVGVVPGKPGAAVAQARPRSSGTGFYISARQVVTNAHVVAGCAALQDDRGRALSVVSADRGRDLALLTSAEPSRAFLRFNGPGGTQLGESVVVLGYPYAGSPLSTGLNLTTGIVSAQSGINGNTGLFQITAPVQPGNSGGPVIDDSGGVIGVVQARVNDLTVLRATGTVPQNINFAIRGETVEGFLRENGVTVGRVSGGRGLGASAIAATAQEAVVSVRCYG